MNTDNNPEHHVGGGEKPCFGWAEGLLHRSLGQRPRKGEAE
jgi:hypothetical protein